MPIHTVQISEYECGHCGWKWINRTNGKDGQVPLKCAKCKRLNWNDPIKEPIRDIERGLRARLANIECDVTMPQYKWTHILRPNDFCRKFLDIKPRPTGKELIQAIEEQDRKKRHQFMERVIKSRNPEFEYIHGQCCN